MKKIISILMITSFLFLTIQCNKSEKKPWNNIDDLIEKPENLSDISDPENASRASKIVTSILRMFVWTFNNAMNQLIPALLFFNEVFPSIETQNGNQIQLPPEGITDKNCSDSGSFHSEIKNTSNRAKNITIVFNNCTGNFGSKDLPMNASANGGISLYIEDTDFNGNSPDESGWFPDKMSGGFSDIIFNLAQNNAEIEMGADLTMNMNGFLFAMAFGMDPQMPEGISLNITMNGIMSAKGFFIQGDNKIGIDYIVFFDGVLFNISGNVINISGGWRMQDNIEPANSFEAVFENMTIFLDTENNIWSESIGKNSLIYSKCINGMVGINTIENINLTFPECPTTGVIEVTGSHTTDVLFTPDGGISIDIGADGAVEKNYPLCESPEFTACGMH